MDIEAGARWHGDGMFADTKSTEQTLSDAKHARFFTLSEKFLNIWTPSSCRTYSHFSLISRKRNLRGPLPLDDARYAQRKTRDVNNHTGESLTVSYRGRVRGRGRNRISSGQDRFWTMLRKHRSLGVEKALTILRKRQQPKKGER